MFKKILFLLLCLLTFFKTNLHAIAFQVNNLSNDVISATIRLRTEPVGHVVDVGADITGTIIDGPILIEPADIPENADPNFLNNLDLPEYASHVFDINPGDYTLEIRDMGGDADQVILGTHITVAASGIGNTFDVEANIFGNYEPEGDNENEEPEEEYVGMNVEDYMNEEDY